MMHFVTHHNARIIRAGELSSIDIESIVATIITISLKRGRGKRKLLQLLPS
jgi:hypothetical protein